MKTTVGSLKKLIEGLADDTVVLVPARDHCYRSPKVTITQVSFEGAALWGEWDPGAEEPTLTAVVIGA